MKTTNLTPYYIGAALMFLSPLAMAGNESAHGGDLQCDAAIQGITANIESWIRDQGPVIGKLNLSTSKNPTTRQPYTIQAYDQAMLSLLAKRLDSNCVRAGDAGYPVEVGGNQKVCKNYVDSDGIHLTCDRTLFLSLSEDQRIQQIHHEYATDIPGLEPDDGGISSYRISTQLSAFTQDVPERRLVVMAPPSSIGQGMSFTQIPLNNYCGDQIPAGSACFEMGSPTSEANHDTDENQHEVVLTKSFEMETTPVTQAQWFAIMGTNPSSFCSKDACPTTHELVQGANGQLTCMCPNNPVEQVSYDDAQTFIQKLNSKQDGHSYSLPTEAEYEYSARAGTSTAFYFGDDASQLDAHAWDYNNSGSHTHEVATKPANGFGLYDMEGNVWEWVSDWYADDYGLASGCNVTEDPMGPSSGSSRVLRGGSWKSGPLNLRSARRDNFAPGNRDDDVGFRLVRTSP